MWKRILLLCLAASAWAGDDDAKTNTDPTKLEVPLPAQSGWKASLIIDNDGVGIWTVDSFQVFPQFGCPEVVGLDDKGRCLVMVSYSGKWTPYRTISDGKWLGGLAHGDVDPRIEGSELYTGSQRGNIYQVVGYKNVTLDNRLIAQLPGREIHTLVARRDGLVVFTRPGGLFLVTPTGEDGRFETRLIEELPGRVRQAVALPTGEIVTVARTGKLHLLSLTSEGTQWKLIYEAEMGMGRIALRPPQPGKPTVIYATHDDGRILRFERDGATWHKETVYLGPQGPRGVAAGRFDADPNVETIAVFGYSRKVQLLSRRETGWEVETLFVDRDKGHWLAAVELDGRNATHELVASGYGTRIVLLSRPPGYGRTETTDNDPEPTECEEE
jgi:hypothetical protein